MILSLAAWAAAAAMAGVTLPADESFCGVEAAPAAEEPPSCKLPHLPCGPVPPGRIGPSGAEPQEDLDGDGRPDITLAGRRQGPKPAAYGVIYRATDAGYVLADYHPVEVRADPAVATVTRALKGGPPLLRDGYDLPLAEGTTLSIARLRRWDGHRFRTLLSFCAHRIAAPPGAPQPRAAQNRVDFVDVNQDGTPEVVLSGYLRARVYRFSPDGLELLPDPVLTQRYRDNSPEEKRARALMAEASSLYSRGEWRRAAAALERAHGIAPYNTDVSLQLAHTLVRLDDAERAVQLLKEAQAIAPERTALLCALAEAHRRAGDDDEERAALDACLDRDPGPPPEQRRSLEARRKKLQEPPVPDGGGAGPRP